MDQIDRYSSLSPLIIVKRIFYFLIFLSLFRNFIEGGNYGDAFLQIGSTPQTIALGQAVVAIPKQPGGFLTNPATLGNIHSSVFYLMISDQFSLAHYYSFGFSTPLKGDWVGSIHLLSFSTPDIPIRPDLRQIFSIVERRDMIRELSSSHYKTFDDWETGMILSFTRSLNIKLDLGWEFEKVPLSLPYGINIKAIHKKFYHLEGYGLGLDLGSLIWFHIPDVVGPDWLGDIAFGFALRDFLGTIIYWNTKHQDKIPQDLVVGTSYKQEIPWIPIKILFSVQSSNRFREVLRMGSEVSILDKVAIRLGNDLDQFQSGIGIKTSILGKLVSLDYSFSHHDLGESHRLGGGIEF